MTEDGGSASVLCAGRIYGDLLFKGAPRLPSFGTETFAQGLEIFAGGGAFISAAAFQTLGIRTALFGVLPAAPFAELVRSDIIAKGVNIEFCVEAAAGADPQITVAMAGDNDRAFLSRRSGDAVPAVSESLFEQFSHLHIGELRSLTEHPELLTYARAAGVTVSLDCGWDDELMQDGATLANIINKVDVFLPNEMEYDSLLNSGLVLSGSVQTIVKCGADGAKALIGDTEQRVAAPKVIAIDTTGAGDAFNAGFLTGWLNGDSLVACMTTGNQCGAAVVSACGGTAGLARLRPAKNVARQAG